MRDLEPWEEKTNLILIYYHLPELAEIKSSKFVQNEQKQ